MPRQTRALERRRVLVVLGVSGAVGVAGCIGGDDEDGDEGDDATAGGCEEAATDDPQAVLPDDGAWEQVGDGGQGGDSVVDYEYSVYRHEEYHDTHGFAIHILDHDGWERDKLLAVTDLFGSHDPPITYVEVGDWVYLATGPAHESNRALLEHYEYVSADCAQGATVIDPEDE